MPISINSRAKITINSNVNVDINYPGNWVFPFNMSLTTIDSPDSGGTGINLGMKFKSDKPGYIKQARFWKTTGNTGSHVATLYDNSGNVLNTSNYNNETATGWQSTTFTASTFISANTVYVISLFVPMQQAPNVYYFSNASWFTTSNNNYVKTGNLYAVYDDGPDGPNGVYIYGNSPAFPTSSLSGTWYSIDVLIDDNP